MSKYQEMTPEEIEEYRRKRREYYQNLTKEEKERRRIQRRERRRKNGKPEKELEANRKWAAKNNIKIQKQAQDLKQKCVELKGGKCFACNNSFPSCVFDFHHRDVNQKEEQLSVLIYKAHGEMTQELLSELHKCDLLCSNCHRIHHHVKQKTP
jgi:hypothetical protein